MDGRAVPREGAGTVQRRLPLAVVVLRLGVPRSVEKTLGLVPPWRSLVSVAFGEVLGCGCEQRIPPRVAERRRLAQDSSLRFGVELVKATWQVAHDGPVDRLRRQILRLRQLGVVRERERLAACLQAGATLTAAKFRRRRLVRAQQAAPSLRVCPHCGHDLRCPPVPLDPVSGTDVERCLWFARQAAMLVPLLMSSDCTNGTSMRSRRLGLRGLHSFRSTCLSWAFRRLYRAPSTGGSDAGAGLRSLATYWQDQMDNRPNGTDTGCTVSMRYH